MSNLKEVEAFVEQHSKLRYRKDSHEPLPYIFLKEDGWVDAQFQSMEDFMDALRLITEESDD